MVYTTNKDYHFFFRYSYQLLHLFCSHKKRLRKHYLCLKILRRLKCGHKNIFNCKKSENLCNRVSFLTGFELDNSTGFHIVTQNFHCFDWYHSQLHLTCKWSFYHKIWPCIPQNGIHKSSMLSGELFDNREMMKSRTCLNFCLFPEFSALPWTSPWEAHFIQDSWPRTLSWKFCLCVALL